MKNAIEITNLYKEYRLGVVGHGTLYRDLQSLYAKMRGREDPNSLIGTDMSVSKKSVIAINNINLDVRKGEVLGIIGPNGAGKSTLLKVLSRITSPTSGSIKYEGRLSSLLEVGTGFHPELTGRDNIFLNGSINGMAEKEIKKKLDEIVDFAGVINYLDTPVKRYSSGMHVRLGFAVAAHLDPDIFVVDEVLAVGDAEFQKKAIYKMEDISKNSGRTVLFVSHNMDSIKKFCTKTLLLEKGKILKYGNTEEVVNFYLNRFDNEEAKSSQLSFKRDKIKKFQLLSMSLSNSKSDFTNLIDRKDNFKIMIKYIVDVKTSDLQVDISITTFGQQNGVSHGTLVLQWSEQHYKKLICNDERVTKDPGTYEAVVNVPGYLLNSGKYSIKASLALAGNWYEKIDKEILFELDDSGSSHTLKTGRSAGLVAPPLDWSEKKING